MYICLVKDIKDGNFMFVVRSILAGILIKIGMLFSWLDKVVIWIIMVKVEAPLLFSMMLSRSKKVN